MELNRHRCGSIVVCGKGGKCLKPCMGGASRFEKHGELKRLAILGQETNVVGVKVSELE